MFHAVPNSFFTSAFVLQLPTFCPNSALLCYCNALSLWDEKLCRQVLSREIIPGGNFAGTRPSFGIKWFWRFCEFNTRSYIFLSLMWVVIHLLLPPSPPGSGDHQQKTIYSNRNLSSCHSSQVVQRKKVCGFAGGGGRMGKTTTIGINFNDFYSLNRSVEAVGCH